MQNHFTYPPHFPIQDWGTFLVTTRDRHGGYHDWYTYGRGGDGGGLSRPGSLADRFGPLEHEYASYPACIVQDAWSLFMPEGRAYPTESLITLQWVRGTYAHQIYPNYPFFPVPPGVQPLPEAGGGEEPWDPDDPPPD